MTLQELIEDLGYETRSYSGRGMYGRECLGVTVDDPVFFALEIGQEMGSNEEYNNFGRNLPCVSWDSMGRDYIVYFPNVYCPNVPYNEENDEEENEDED